MSEDATYTVTLKASGDYSSPWTVVRADNPAELEEHLDALTESLLQKVNDVNALFAGAHNATPATTNTGSSSAGQGASVSPGQGSNVTTLHTCEHGKRVRREGVSSRGAWVGHFCPRPKGAADQCKPVFEDN